MQINIKQFFSYSIFTGVCFPLLLWLLFTPWSATLDLHISHVFYTEGRFMSHPFWDWIYDYAIWPAWFVVGIACLGYIFSFKSSYRAWRTPCLYLILALALGGGVIHAVLKDHWGRPRPRQIIEFGGLQPFRAYYEPNIARQPEPSKSFACGHACMGYYFFALTFLGIIYHLRWLYWLGLGLGWGLGILLSIARIVQGGHFLSDTLASALIMWLAAWGLAYLLFASKGFQNERLNA